jgi:hypothetical protein
VGQTDTTSWQDENERSVMSLTAKMKVKMEMAPISVDGKISSRSVVVAGVRREILK